MTEDMPALRGLLEKTPDSDLLREMIGFAAHRLMELEVEGRTGAALIVWFSATAIANVTGKPAPERSSCGYRNCARGRISPVFSSRGGWRRRR